MIPTQAAPQIAAMRERPSLRPLTRTSGSEMDSVLIIAIRVLRALLRSEPDGPATRHVRQCSSVPDSLDMAYAASLIGVACSPLRFLVSATATENIQMKPR